MTIFDFLKIGSTLWIKGDILLRKSSRNVDALCILKFNSPTLTISARLHCTCSRSLFAFFRPYGFLCGALSRLSNFKTLSFERVNIRLIGLECWDLKSGDVVEPIRLRSPTRWTDGRFLLAVWFRLQSTIVDLCFRLISVLDKRQSRNWTYSIYL